MSIGLGGCANDVAPREGVTIGGAKSAADRGGIDCSTTCLVLSTICLVLATVSTGGSGGIGCDGATE